MENPALRFDCGLGLDNVYLISLLASQVPTQKSGKMDILGKSTRKSLLAADFLATDKRVNRHRNGAVDVLRRAVFGQPHLAESFRNTHNGFKVTDLDKHLVSVALFTSVEVRRHTVIG